MSDQPLWAPSPERLARTNLVRFAAFAGMDSVSQGAASFDYAALHRWSIASPEKFWPAVWTFCGVVSDDGGGTPWTDVVHGLERMGPPDPSLGPHWFRGARLNFAENLLRYRDDQKHWCRGGSRGVAPR
jgi:acetoacetyl-CoA synthetase